MVVLLCLLQGTLSAVTEGYQLFHPKPKLATYKLTIAYNSEQNVWNKVKKPSKTGPELRPRTLNKTNLYEL